MSLGFSHTILLFPLAYKQLFFTWHEADIRLRAKIDGIPIYYLLDKGLCLATVLWVYELIVERLCEPYDWRRLRLFTPQCQQLFS